MLNSPTARSEFSGIPIIASRVIRHRPFRASACRSMIGGTRACTELPCGLCQEFPASDWNGGDLGLGPHAYNGANHLDVSTLRVQARCATIITTCFLGLTFWAPNVKILRDQRWGYSTVVGSQTGFQRLDRRIAEEGSSIISRQL